MLRAIIVGLKVNERCRVLAVSGGGDQAIALAAYAVKSSLSITDLSKRPSPNGE